MSVCRTVVGLLVAGLVLAGTHAVTAQSVADFETPIVSGERVLRFRVDAAGERLDRLAVTVFYADRASALDDLRDPDLSRGRPVLLRDQPAGGLTAEFVFPHEDYPADPNRSLYVKARATATDVMPYPEVDQQVQAGGGIIDWSGLLGDWVPGGVDAPSPLDTNPVVHRRGTCVYYRVRIARAGTVLFDSPVAWFVMPDTYNVAIVGDSYGAGEGTPQDEFEAGGDNADMWSHDDCHRSRRSGLVRSLKRFIQRRPDVAVDYVHVACTGARVRHLTSDEQTRAVLDFSEPHPVQFDTVEDPFLEGRDGLNLLLVSIGGNDAGFGAYVADFIVLPGNAADDEELPGEIEDNLETLEESLRGLDEEVRARFPAAKVAIATYPDSTNGPRGRCGRAPGPVEFAATYFCCLQEVDPITNPVEEYRFTANDFIRPLNDVIRDAAGDSNEPDAWPDWYVIETEEEMGAHGFCACDEPHINRLGMSVLTQGDIFGVAHPTLRGYREAYRAGGASTIEKAFTDFIAERKGALFIAILLGLDRPTLPKPCAGQATRVSPLFPLLQALDLFPPREPLLRHFVYDDGVRDARRRGRPEGITDTAAYRHLKKNEAEARAIVARAFPEPQKRTAKMPAAPETARQEEARRRLRAYLASPEYAEVRRRILSQPAPVREPGEDRLDDVFNRPDARRRTAR